MKLFFISMIVFSLVTTGFAGQSGVYGGIGMSLQHRSGTGVVANNASILFYKSGTLPLLLSGGVDFKTFVNRFDRQKYGEIDFTHPTFDLKMKRCVDKRTGEFVDSDKCCDCADVTSEGAYLDVAIEAADIHGMGLLTGLGIYFTNDETPVAVFGLTDTFQRNRNPKFMLRGYIGDGYWAGRVLLFY